MLRIPVARVNAKSLKGYFVGDAARANVAGQHLVLDLRSEDEDPEYDEENQGSLAALAPLRAELMRGDLRVAYIAWLLAVQAGDVAETETEPPVPPGLTDLTAAHAAMVEFLRIDEDLISAAAEASARENDVRPALREWILALPPRAKDAWLRRAIDDPDLALGGKLVRAFRAEVKPGRAPRRRTVAELLAKVEAHRAKRERAEKDRAAKAKRATEAARNKRLDGLRKRVDPAWNELEALVTTSAYDDALKLAVDLRDLANRDGGSVSFAAAFAAMRKRQLRRRGFFDRWKRENEPRRW